MHCISPHARLYRLKYRIFNAVLGKNHDLGCSILLALSVSTRTTFLATALPLRSTLYMTYFHNHRDTLHCLSSIDISTR